jgi:hypothetical protein
MGRANWSAYDATKAGLLALTRSLACEEAANGIRANAVCATATLTTFTIGRRQSNGLTVEDMRNEGRTDNLFKRWCQVVIGNAVRDQRPRDGFGRSNSGRFPALRSPVGTADETVTATANDCAEKTMRGVRQATRRRCSTERRNRIVVDGLHGESGIAEFAVGPSELSRNDN